MEKIAYPCPCGGSIQWKKDKVIVDGVDCGILDVEYCEACGEEYFPEESMQIVEQKLKEKGLWGIQRKEARLWQSGNSVIIRIPKEMTEKLNLKPNEKVVIYTEGKKKIIIDV